MEINEFHQKYIKPNLPKTKKEWVWFLLIILVIVTLGLVAMNSYLGMQYKATLIQNPCALCDTFQQNYYNGRVLELPNGINLSIQP